MKLTKYIPLIFFFPMMVFATSSIQDTNSMKPQMGKKGMELEIYTKEGKLLTVAQVQGSSGGAFHVEWENPVVTWKVDDVRYKYDYRNVAYCRECEVVFSRTHKGKTKFITYSELDEKAKKIARHFLDAPRFSVYNLTFYITKGTEVFASLSLDDYISKRWEKELYCIDNGKDYRDPNYVQECGKVRWRCHYYWSEESGENLRGNLYFGYGKIRLSQPQTQSCEE